MPGLLRILAGKIFAQLQGEYDSSPKNMAVGSDGALQVNLSSLTMTSHGSSHTDGTDDIQDASAGQKGLATAAQITKLDGIETTADVTDATNVDAAGATMNADTDISGNDYVVDEDDMDSDLATKVPTQQSVKAFVNKNIKNNLLTNSGFGVWSGNSALANYGAALIDDDCADDDTGDWGVVDCTLAFDTDHYEVNYSAATQYVYQAISVTAGHLYRISVDIKDGTLSGEDVLIGAGQAVSNLDAGSKTVTTTGSWVTHTVVFKAAPDTDTFALGTFMTGAGNIEIKNISLYEVTPGCIAADNLACDGWYKDATLDIYREPNGSNTKDGSCYAIKLSPTTANDYLLWPKDFTSDLWISPIGGRTLAFGAWVKTSTASQLRLQIYDGSSYQSSDYHTGGGDWEWIELSVTVESSPSSVQFLFLCSQSSGDVYISQPMLIFGNSIGEGNYSKPNEEIIWFEKFVGSNKFEDTTGLSDENAQLELQADSNGAVPAGAKEVLFYIRAYDSGSSTASSCFFYCRIDSDRSLQRIVELSGQANNKYRSDVGWQQVDENTEFEFVLNASGAGTMTMGSFRFMGVKI